MTNVPMKSFTAICLLSIVLVAFAVTAPIHAASLGKGEVNQRMATAASPYLQTHSNDLVRWQPWGEEAFAKARKMSLPIMVSFGYTACHWCHVMQEKHFNDPQIAKAINENFVPVLVDRERRPALDETYMLVTEVLTQRGGWPNTVFMTPALKPIYGTGYIPPDVFTQVLASITVGWRDDRSALTAEAERISGLLAGYLTRSEAAQDLTPQVLSNAAKILVGQFDEMSGGMGSAPKFFQQPVLMFLLQQAARGNHPGALAAVEHTLQAVSSGGIHDHLEGGFHRYAIDPGWRVPHFEKMLYDQAQMAEAYTTAYQLTGKPEYAATARKTLDYILADLTDPAGGFYATRDADSEDEEGTYYVWTPDQLEAALGIKDAALAANTFGTIADGDFAGKIILNTDDVDTSDLPQVQQTFKILRRARVGRPKPRRDEKIVASWNGMTIASLAAAAITLSEPRYGSAAIKAGEFIWANMRKPAGGLFRSYFSGTAQIDAELDDYAQLARGFIFLFDLTADQVWLKRATILASEMRTAFEDPKSGDFYATAKTEGFARLKPRSDIDQPSGNAVALDVLARMARRAEDPAFRHQSQKTIAALSGIALKDAASGASILSAADRFSRGETGMVQFAGNGVVRVSVDPAADKQHVVLRLRVTKGWHVNAHKPLQDYLIPTVLKATSGKQTASVSISYPDPLLKKLEFSEKPMSLYDGDFELTARFDKAGDGTATAILDVQTCSDTICLQPEKLVMQFAWPD